MKKISFLTLLLALGISHANGVQAINGPRTAKILTKGGITLSSAVLAAICLVTASGLKEGAANLGKRCQNIIENKQPLPSDNPSHEITSTGLNFLFATPCLLSGMMSAAGSLVAKGVGIFSAGITCLAGLSLINEFR